MSESYRHLASRISTNLNCAILCADDYGISPGVSAGIEKLAYEKRISAISSLVTFPDWPTFASRVSQLRSQTAVGLHINLTLGKPLGPMPHIAPTGIFLPMMNLLTRSFLSPPDQNEIASEISRQIACFEDQTGYAPDFIDGHQHIHAMPTIRPGFIRALLMHFPERGILIRDPYDTMPSIFSRGGSLWKALGVAILARGFGSSVRRYNFITNQGFAGFSSFRTDRSFAREFEGFLLRPGHRHMIMCHPGYPDAELARRDRVVARRQEELDYLLKTNGLPDVIWHLRKRDQFDRPIWP